MVKLIMTDIDGTLIPDGTMDINPEYFEVIEKLVEKGIIFVVASGRHMSSVKKVFAPVLDKIWVASQNGNVLTYHGKSRIIKSIPQEWGREMWRQFSKLKGVEGVLDTATEMYCPFEETSMYKILAYASVSRGGKAIKAGMVKALASGITAAVIGSGVFIGGKALKQHQGDKKVITSGQDYSTQEEKEGTPDSSVKEFVDDNQAFIKEILALEAEVPEGTEFQTDINENVRSVVYTSLGLLCDNKSFGEEATNIYDAVPEESIVDYNNNDDGEGTISVEESGFENMRQFLGCKETIGSLSATSSEEFLCQDGEVRAEGLSPSSDMQSSIKDIVYIPLSNGDERAIFTEQIIQDEIDGIGTAVITKADNDLGVQLKSYNIVADSDKIDQLLGSVAVLGNQLGSDGKLFSGNMTEMSDESKIHALIDSVRGYCYTEPNDEDIYANRAESLVYKPVFSEDDIKSNTEKSIIVKEDAFDDYLALVDYDGTIDDIVANKALQNKYNCSIKRNGTNIEFTFSGEFEMTYWWVETDMIDQINKDGFKILKNGKIEVDCLLYTSHATEPDPGVEYKATLSLNEDGSGMKLENLERV